MYRKTVFIHFFVLCKIAHKKLHNTAPEKIIFDQKSNVRETFSQRSRKMFLHNRHSLILKFQNGSAGNMELIFSLFFKF